MMASIVQQGRRARVAVLTGMTILSMLSGSQAVAQGADSVLTIYGFAMTDVGFSLEQNHPDWFDVVRPTKLPAFEDEFGIDIPDEEVNDIKTVGLAVSYIDKKLNEGQKGA